MGAVHRGRHLKILKYSCPIFGVRFKLTALILKTEILKLFKNDFHFYGGAVYAESKYGYAVGGCKGDNKNIVLDLQNEPIIHNTFSTQISVLDFTENRRSFGYVSIHGGTRTVRLYYNSDAVPSERAENIYQTEIPGINALCLTDEYTVEINEVTIKLCAFSYCNLAVQHSTSQNVIEALRAMYEFYDATDKYLNPVTESEVAQ